MYRSIDREWVFEELPAIPWSFELELEAFEQYVTNGESDIPKAEYGATIFETIDKVYNG